MKSPSKHHFTTFYVLVAITEGTELAVLAAELDSYRADRHAANYGFGMTESRARDQLASLHRLHEQFLPAARAWLARERNGIEASLAPLP